MTPDEIEQASEILKKDAKNWSKSDNDYIYKLIKKGHRDALKMLRTQVLLDSAP